MRTFTLLLLFIFSLCLLEQGHPKKNTRAAVPALLQHGNELTEFEFQFTPCMGRACLQLAELAATRAPPSLLYTRSFPCFFFFSLSLSWGSRAGGDVWDDSCKLHGYTYNTRRAITRWRSFIAEECGGGCGRREFTSSRCFGTSCCHLTHGGNLRPKALLSIRKVADYPDSRV